MSSCDIPFEDELLPYVSLFADASELLLFDDELPFDAELPEVLPLDEEFSDAIPVEDVSPVEEPSLEVIVSFVALKDTAVAVELTVLLVVTGTFAERDTAVTSSESALVPVIPLSAELMDDDVPVDDCVAEEDDANESDPETFTDTMVPETVAFIFPVFLMLKSFFSSLKN